VYQHKFEWFITDNKLIHQFENGYTFARVWVNETIKRHIHAQRQTYEDIVMV
jgi:hypothetical protein